MPSITGVLPQAFGDGTEVVVSGTGFGVSGDVLIGGAPQLVLTWEDTEITFTAIRGNQSMGPAPLAVVPVATDYPYTVYPILPEGIFSNDVIPNTSAWWRVISADSPERWQWYNGGGYVFDALGAAPGTYVAIYEVENWNGAGANASSSITVTVA
jgi:hypothetical protein